MNHYEVLAIITSTLADTEVPSAIVKIEETLKKHECTIHYSQNLERRKLAYPIAHQQYGSYALIEFDCAPEHIGSLEHDFRLAPELLRHVIVKRSEVGKPRPLFKEVEASFTEKRPARKEIKTVSLDEALQTVEQETKEAQKNPAHAQESSVQPLREDLMAAQPGSPDISQPLSDEDLEKQLNDKLAEILKDGI
ncbi:30S ribosomal protein S6 [Candidatus Uhrbacteria bacterium]|nr:30S ribosomal protein S6 [Candidatus Uhrbacteria bacterium]